MKKILLLSVGFDGGGSGKITAMVENFLNKSYDTVTLVFFEDKGIFSIKGKKINISSLFSFSFPGRGYIELIFHIVCTIKYIKNEKPDIVIGGGAYCNLLGLIARSFLNFKLLLTQHEHISSRKENIFSVYHLIYYITKMIIGNNKIVCVSNEVKLDTIKQYGIKETQAKTIYNGLDFNLIKSLGNEPISIKDKFIINIGALDVRKNQEMLLKVYSKSQAKNKYKLLLLGEGPQKDFLKKLTNNLNIERNVIFAGFDNNPYKYLKNASMFCFTSLSEALPTVLIESLILKIPILTVPVIGSKEILANGKCGIITKNWDIDTYAKLLDTNIDTDNSEMIDKGYKYAEENFEISSMINNYKDLLNNL